MQARSSGERPIAVPKLAPTVYRPSPPITKPEAADGNRRP